MTTFTITERGGWWHVSIIHYYPHAKPVAYGRHAGILEASAAVQDRWPKARLVAIQ